MLSKRKNNFNNLREEYLKDKSDISFYNLPKKVEFCEFYNIWGFRKRVKTKYSDLNLIMVSSLCDCFC